ncbi:MAG TPA: DNA-formamidopyrimidine glycosylase family protein [Gemmatimonadaceae bacterium]|nr:DNA-formamidopyrimidine glycosylase family protein [Gemmatimonadaceae bacterium]
MPELPDITVYVESLERFVVGRTLERITFRSPFVLRSVAPPPSEFEGRTVTGASRIGKRLVLGFGGGRAIVIHLMVAGRLKWTARTKGQGAKILLAAFDFDNGTLLLTEASKKKRASIHLVGSPDELAGFDRGGLDVVSATPAQFAERLRSASHTLKRALTDPTLFDGIGNAYSDEILHRAKLSPLMLTGKLDDAQVDRLHKACIAILAEWTARLRAETGDAWPEKVTAFRPEMAVHGRYQLPCPACGSPVQRIRYADNETNYCATCQTGGRLLADRALSRLLKEDWPRSIDEYDGMIRKGLEG